VFDDFASFKFNIAYDIITFFFLQPFPYTSAISINKRKKIKKNDGYLEQKLLRQGVIQKRGFCAPLYVITRITIWLQHANKTKRDYLKKLKDFEVSKRKTAQYKKRREEI